MARYVALDPAGREHSKLTAATHAVFIQPLPEVDRARVRDLCPNPEVRAERLANIERQIADGYFDRWQNMGWCRSLEAAARLQTNQQARGVYADVQIVEVRAE